MALRATFLLLLLVVAVALVARTSAWRDGEGVDHASIDNSNESLSNGVPQIEETTLESESQRRNLWEYPPLIPKYISYAALAKNRVPCNKRGQSYYQCTTLKHINPYRRGCSWISHCARYLY